MTTAQAKLSELSHNHLNAATLTPNDVSVSDLEGGVGERVSPRGLGCYTKYVKSIIGLCPKRLYK